MNQPLWNSWARWALAGLLGTLGLGMVLSRPVPGPGTLSATGEPSHGATQAPRPLSAREHLSSSGPSTGKRVHVVPVSRRGGSEHSQGKVRLNAIQTPWEQFLRYLARQTGSHLVMKQAPPGRFHHLSTRLYTRQEAIELVNEQLQPLGYRLLDQGRHLVLVELEQLRSRYPRHRLKPATQAAEGQAQEQANTVRGLLGQAVGPRPLSRRKMQVASMTPKRKQEPVASVRRFAPPGAGEKEPSPIQQTTHLQPVPSAPARLPQPVRPLEPLPEPKTKGPHSLASPTPRFPATLPAAETDGPASPSEANFATGPVRVPLRRWQAVDVARVLYRAYRSQAALVESGPGGLPGFEVYEKRDAAAPGHPLQQEAPVGNRPQRLFAVGIDNQRQLLVIEGTASHGQAIATAAQVVDSLPPVAGKAVELVPTQKKLQGKTHVLQTALNHLVAQAGKGQPRGDAAQAPAAGQPAQLPAGQAPPGGQLPAGQAPPGGQPPAGQAPGGRPQPGETPAGEGEPLLRIDALRGPVTIQDVPGIGLVVTGNKEDVDAVVRIIRELERVAGGAVPNIHLLVLKHVNSESLAALLNSVYQELGAIRSPTGTQVKRASILPVVRPNALLIVASQGDIQAISQLAAQLDKPLDPQSEVQVFPLKHAVATQVAAALESLYPETQPQGQQAAPGLAPRVRVVADVRTNTLIVQARPRDLKEVALVVQRLDRDDSAAVNRMQVFPLKHAVAAELAEVINAAIQSVLNPAPAPTLPGQATGQVGAAAGQGQVPQQLREIKSVALEFLTSQGDAQKLVRSGVLADVRVTADPRINALIVTAPQQSMELMAALIAHLDRPSPAVAEIKVFTLANSDATAMAELLQNLFATGTQQPGQQGEAQGIQLVGAEGIGSTLVPLRFSVDVRTNSIIAMGGADALRVVEAILLRLDQTDVRQRQSTVVRLKNSPAADVAEAINQFLQSQRELMQIDPELVSNIELLEREIIVVPEPVSNSLLISATPRYYDEILELVRKLDQAPAQVVIQALLVEVELENTDEFGVELGVQDSVLFDRSLLNLDNFQTIQQTVTNTISGVATTTETIVNEERIPGFLFNNQQLGNNTRAHPSRVGTQGLSSFSVGRINGDLGFGGLVLSASSNSVSVLIRALAAKRKVRVLSRPQIRTLDNQLAVIHVGQQVPVISGATTNQAGGVTPVIGTPQLVGIILQVTPRISPDGTIVMETIATKSAISGQGVPILTDPSTGNVIESPIFDLTEARTTVSVPDGQTVVLGGMITKREEVVERKVPWLGDLPLLGAPFRYDGKVTRRTELLIFLTPRIVHSAEDAELIKQVEIQRLNFDLHEAEAIHGPIMSVVEPAGGVEQLPLPSEEDQANTPTTVMPPQKDDKGRGAFWRRGWLPWRVFGRREETEPVASGSGTPADQTASRSTTSPRPVLLRPESQLAAPADTATVPQRTGAAR